MSSPEFKNDKGWREFDRNNDNNQFQKLNEEKDNNEVTEYGRFRKKSPSNKDKGSQGRFSDF